MIKPKLHTFSIALFLVLTFNSYAQITDTSAHADTSAQDTSNLQKRDKTSLKDTAPGTSPKPENDTAISTTADTSTSLNTVKSNKEERYSNKSDTVEISAVGDIMLGTDFPELKYLPPYNKACSLLAPIAPHIKSSDVRFGNLEGAFNDGAGLVKKCNDPDICYAFRTPQKYFSCITRHGLNLFSLSNNHIFDFGMPAVDSTLALTKKHKVYAAGVNKKAYEIFEKNGTRYGFTAYSPNKGTNDFHDTTALKNMVQKLADTSDIVIVSFHIGAEGKEHQHITRKTEMYYGENRGNPYKLARMVIDAGADLVFGHGPHVVRAIDLYKNRFIAYSLGNFCTYSRMNLDGPNGLAPLIKIKTDQKGKFIEGQILSFKQFYGKGIKKDNLHRAAIKIKALTETDIPECLLKIKKNGYFSK